MRTSPLLPVVLLMMVPVLWISSSGEAQTTSPVPATEQAAPRYINTITLPGVSGRLDHLAHDPVRKRLFVAAFDNATVQVIDLVANKRVGSVKVFHKPQGVAWLADLEMLAVACGGGEGQVLLYDRDLKHLSTIDNFKDADQLRYDPADKKLYVGYSSGLGIIDPQRRTYLGAISLPAHAEGFQLQGEGPRIFVNVPRSRQVLVIDRGSKRVLETWSTADAKGNFPLALDESTHRILIACRVPAKLLALDTRTSAIVASIDCVQDADDLFVDTGRRIIYVVGGEGRVDMVRMNADRLEPAGTIPTALGARTGLLDANARRLYIAVSQGDHPTPEVRVYELPPVPAD